jgi:aconitate hydratase
MHTREEKMEGIDSFGTKKSLHTDIGSVMYYSLEELEKKGAGVISCLPFTVKIILEAVLRQVDGKTITGEDVSRVAGWNPKTNKGKEIPFKPSRIIMQDFTGVPAVVDLAAMRDALISLDCDPAMINPRIPVDLVIDHSVQVDQYGTVRALENNSRVEFKRNRERYEFLRWGAEAFEGFRVVPPATGIVHQVNLEYLAHVVTVRGSEKRRIAFPDTLVGTDSHTTMINGLGVLGWGVGGIEAEAGLLGEPVSLVMPEVIGFKLKGKLQTGVTATDLVLAITKILRNYGVVGKFIEFFGPGVSSLSLPDRATISNMTPEYGATVTFFPVDAETLAYLRFTGRKQEQTALVEQYTKIQGIFRTDDTPDPLFNDVIELDMESIEPAIAGPKRPQDHIPLRDVKDSAQATLEGKKSEKAVPVDINGTRVGLRNGSVVISAITSCTNTSNPSVLIGAGLLAKRAVELGLRVSPHVKTSFAPGSRVVTRYLEESGLLPYLEALGFHLVGYGCTTCIGNSGPLNPAIKRVIHEHDLTVASVLSGNRNFEGRIHPDVRANFLASPPLVVAFALAGRIDIDLTSEPVGHDPNGKAVFLKEIWPLNEEINTFIQKFISPALFSEEYRNVFTGNKTWNDVNVSKEKVFPWNATSTYIRKPPFFEGMSRDVPEIESISGARVLVLLGDTITTDHISPAGAIPKESSAGKWLMDQGVDPENFNTYGSRRGNHEVMMRGTFGNIRIRNRLLKDTEGGYTVFFPSGEQLSIFEAAMKYQKESIPLIVLAGKEYGAGSSRDWAAKGTALLGVRAVVAESFERIHRSNLIGMGVLPLQFRDGDSPESLELTGRESFDIENVSGPAKDVKITVHTESGQNRSFSVRVRIDTPVEYEYYRNRGILHRVIRDFASE